MKAHVLICHLYGEFSNWVQPDSNRIPSVFHAVGGGRSSKD